MYTCTCTCVCFILNLASVFFHCWSTIYGVLALFFLSLTFSFPFLLSLSLSPSPLHLSPPPPSLRSAQENSTLAAQLTSQSNTLQESQEQCSRFKLELRRAKEAAKSPGGEGRGHAERASELEARLRQAEDENVSLQVCMYISPVDI